MHGVYKRFQRRLLEWKYYSTVHAQPIEICNHLIYMNSIFDLSLALFSCGNDAVGDESYIVDSVTIINSTFCAHSHCSLTIVQLAAALYILMVNAA